VAYQETTFNLPKELLEQLAEFKKKQDANILAKQVKAAEGYLTNNPTENYLDINWMWANGIMRSAKLGIPYRGCSGGGYSYTFSPTTVGMSIKVTCNSTKESLDYFQEY
jgi:hypothetical protein